MGGKGWRQYSNSGFLLLYQIEMKGKIMEEEGQKNTLLLFLTTLSRFPPTIVQ
jgi:hypothetical protein